MAYSTTKFVNPESGIDTNAGTQEAPYKTLAKADSVATASTRVYLRGGTYREYFAPTKAGSSGTDNDIRYEGYPGEVPLFLGDKNYTPIVKIAGSVKYTTFKNISMHWGYTTVPNNNYKFALIQAIGPGVDHILLDGLTLERLGYDNIADLYNTKWKEWGAIFENTPDCEMRNCTIRGVRKGLHVKGAAYRAYIHNNDIGPTVQSPIVVSGSHSGQMSDILIAFNRLFGSYIEDGIQALPGDSGTDNAPTDNWGVIVYGNDIFSNNENGVDLKGTQFWLVEGNYIWNILGSNNGPIGGWDKSGFAIMRGANQDAYDHIIRHNWIWDCGSGVAIRGDGWKVYNNGILYNNSNYLGPNQSYGDFTFQGIYNVEGQDDVGIKNNLAYGTEGGDIVLRITEWGGGSHVIDVDYNTGLVWADRITGTQNGTRYTYSSIRTPLQATSWDTEGEAHSATGTWSGFSFNGLPQAPVGIQTRESFQIDVSSSLYQVGGWLTKTNGSGTGSVTLVLDDSRYFRETSAHRAGDKIFFNGQERTVTGNNRSTNTITLDSAATWTNQTPVFLGTSATPNRGPSAPLGTAGIGGTDTGGGGGVPPTEPPVSAGTGSIVLHVEAANPDGSGNQTFSIASPTGNAPVAVEFFATYATASATPVAHAALSIGAAVDVSNQFAFMSRSQDASADSYCHRRSTTSSCIILNNPSATTLYCEAAFSSMDNAGVTIHWSTEPAAAILIAIRAYYAEEAFIDIADTPGTVDNAVAVTPNFKPNLVRVVSNGKPIGSYTHCRESYGLATVVSDVITQQCDAWTSNNAQTVGSPAHNIVEDRICVFAAFNGTITWTLEMTDLGSTSFNLRTRDGTPTESEQVGVLCVRFTSEVWSDVIDIPSSTANQPYYGPGWQPAYIEVIGTYLTSTGTGDATDKGGAYGIASFDDTSGDLWCIAIAEEDAATTTNTQSQLSTGSFLDIPFDDGSTSPSIQAAAAVMLSNGFEIDYDDVPGTSARKAIAFALQTSLSITPSFEADVTSGVEVLTVTFSNTSTAEGLDPEADITWEWDFGDGNTSSSFEPSHDYNAGIFTVTLTGTYGSIEEVATIETHIVVLPLIIVGTATAPLPGTAILNETVLASGQFGTSLIDPPADPPGLGSALFT